MELIDSDWENSRKVHLDSRRACYLSMEFLMGRAVYNNLLCLGITDEVDELLKTHGRSLNDLEEIEDAASATVVLADLPLASSIPPPLMTCLWTATE